MKLVKALALNLLPDNKKIMISFVGGGGKTSTLFALAYELAQEGRKVLVTTTTAMYNPEGVSHPNISVLGDYVTPEGKLKGLTVEKADEIYGEGCYDFILVEADGSRGRPIKAPAEYEPVVPKSTDILIGVIGMDALGKKLSSSYVHRPEILTKLTETGPEDAINEEVVIKLVANPLGLFKKAPPDALRILLLNKVLEDGTREVARNMGYKVLRTCDFIDRVLLGAVLEEDPVKELLQK